MAQWSQLHFLQALGWATLNSFWQMAILWCAFAGANHLFKLSATKKIPSISWSNVDWVCLVHYHFRSVLPEQLNQFYFFGNSQMSGYFLNKQPVV